MMGFRMSMGHGISQRTHLAHTQHAKMSQRQYQRQTLRHFMTQSHLLTMRIRLLESLHPGGLFTPGGACPSCGHRLTEVEILKGFLPVPDDTTTECPKCKQRFQPRLIAADRSGYTELPFYCEMQTLEKLKQLGPVSYETFQKEHPAILASARFYWGSLKSGFALLKIEYDQEPVMSWKDKIRSFLGKCPDSMIAEVCSVSVSSVRRLRAKEKIVAYVRKRTS